MEQLVRRFHGRPVQFVLVYTCEPHAGEGVYGSVSQPRDYSQREEYAQRTRAELDIHREIVVDDMESNVQKAYGGLPNMIYIIDPDGTVIFHDRWADAEIVAQTLTGLMHQAKCRKVP